ncbi:MAG: sulfite exporter TauE/SafE family protein [Bacteroidetes bacterium]|nr:MAG: sulfite exporter TauE/SafE family protein [Bacteroidota bacterium]
MSDQYWFILFPALFIVAFMYSSVGHGGASGYLALMAIFGFHQADMKATALLLNIFVSLIAFIRFYRAGYFKMKLFLPFAIMSVPAAFLGGMLEVEPDLYKKILGCLLLFPVARLFGLFGQESDRIKEGNFFVSLIIGAGIGFLSGLIGIGGGIILSPIILLFHWGRMKETAAASALFIFVNSLSGLGGQFTGGVNFDPSMFAMLAIALAGGLAGSYYGVHKFNTLFLRRLLAFVLLIASVKLLSI